MRRGEGPPPFGEAAAPRLPLAPPFVLRVPAGELCFPGNEWACSFQGIKAKARGSGNEAASPGSCQPHPQGTPAHRLVPASPKGTAWGSRRGGASEHLRCVTTDFQPPLATVVPPLQLTVKREEKLNAEIQPCLCAAQLPASHHCFWRWAMRSNESGLGKFKL